MAAAGISTAGLAFGGTPPVRALTEEWNGTSWTEGNDLSTARNSLAAAGTSTVALAFSGTTGSNTAVTEEFSAPSFSTKTVDTD